MECLRRTPSSAAATPGVSSNTTNSATICVVGVMISARELGLITWAHVNAFQKLRLLQPTF